MSDETIVGEATEIELGEAGPEVIAPVAPITLGEDEELVTRKIEFRVFSGLLKARENEAGERIFSGIASSTITDHNGDTIAQSAIDDMLASANDNMTIFLNHRYDVPEDVGGQVRKATVRLAGNDPVSPIWDLAFDEVVINEDNERAIKAHKAMKRGIKLGLSIGAKVPEGGATVNRKTGAVTFHHLELHEVSIVGLPANPRSWISSAIKAFRPSDPELEVTAAAMCGADCSGGTCKKPMGHDGAHSSKVQQAFVASDDVTEDLHDQAVADSTTTVPEPPDEGEPEESSSQEAPVSDPETAPGTVTESIVAAATLTDVLSTLSSVTKELLDTRGQRDQAFSERDQAFRERDAAQAMTDQLFQEMGSVVELLASVPVGRKAVVKEAQDTLSGLTRIYGDSMLKKMRGEE